MRRSRGLGEGHRKAGDSSWSRPGGGLPLRMAALVTPLYVLAAAFGAVFGLIEVRMIWRFVRHRSAARRAVRAPETPSADEPGPLPTVTIQLPLYNERFSAERVIRACAAQDYPRDRFDIQVLDDSTDDTVDFVAAIVAELRDEGVRIEQLRRPLRTGFKAGALAEGLPRSEAEFVAVFDADFAPPANFLRHVLGPGSDFGDPRVAFVQTRWAWDRPVRGLLDSALSLLLDRHFFVQKPVRVLFGHVTAFNGSGGIWRRAAIDDAGGWSADTLTEDLDLSYRAALRGWRGHYRHDLAVPNELPRHMRALKVQQRRWSRGTAQSMRKLAPAILRGRDALEDRGEELFLLAGYVIHPILLANLLLWPVAVLYVHRPFFLGLQGLMSLATLAAPLSLLVTAHERDGRWSAAQVGQMLAGMCVGLGLMVNNTVAQVQGLLAGEGEFVRTPKGVPARSRRYRLPLHWTVLAEFAVLAYCVWGTSMLVRVGEPLWTFPLIFWGACVALVIALQLVSLRGSPTTA